MSLLDLFRKKKSSSAVSGLTVVSSDYMTVIDATEIDKIDNPSFNLSQWSSEEEYKSYLESVQPLILEYEATGTIHSLSYESMADIERNRDEQKILDNFRSSFLDVRNWINVKKTISGKYCVCSNGRHRMYVAKKYGLKLIVHVAQEVVKNDNNTL